MSRDVNDKTSLSRLYHLNSEPFVDESPPPQAVFGQKVRTHAGAERTALPKTEKGLVHDLAAARGSQRAFKDVPLSLHDLAALLRVSYGIEPPFQMPGGPRFLRRSVPSAGGLFPLEMYLLVRNVDGLSPGIYHYDSLADGLERVWSGDVAPQASRAFLTWSFAKNAAAVLCMGADFDRCQSKYGPRGYRFVHLEAGHVGQNLCLAAEEKGLSSLCLGGFHDSVLNAMIGLDGVQQAVVYAIAFGHG